MKVLIVCPAGSHLSQLLQLRPWWEQHETAWVTFRTGDAVHRLREQDVTWAHHPTTRHVPNLLRNARLARRVMSGFRPDVVVSTGAGVAVPFVWLCRTFGAESVRLDVFDNRATSPAHTTHVGTANRHAPTARHGTRALCNATIPRVAESAL